MKHNLTSVEIPSGTFTLQGELITPERTPTKVVLLNAGAGISFGYYRKFAKWLAEENGMACLIYDYRDFGQSQLGRMKDSVTSMSDWGVHDQQAARAWLHNRFPDAKVWVLGHSLGGMMLPFQTNTNQIDRVITVASGMINVRDHPFPFLLSARALWYAHGPMLAKLFGYMPGRLSGLKADMPNGVFWQWRRWCLTQGYYTCDIGKALPEPNWEGKCAKVKVIAIADDVMMPPKAVWRLMPMYQGSQMQQMVIKPADYGRKSVGHIGVFAERCKDIWPDIIA